ncbi:sodium-dependent proline transporter-like [Harmonia axyridis]|uniref:sodium-dependent proline transporter-like n=1 Tax=Harmonia axyridis TaxID=115357 RepID=UPI001E2789E9|nr:sodium-dependent proline transporter-like [Harmonia axyridis]
MRFRKYASAVFLNKNAAPYQFKHTRSLRMALGCYVIGRYPLILFPNVVDHHRASLEILPVVIFITLFFSIPLTFATLGLSQYSKKGWIKLWDAAPIWRGIGISGIICLYISTLFLTTACTDFLYYTIRTLETETPWLKCGNQDFLKEGCFTFIANRSIHLDCITMHGEEHCSNLVWKNSAQYFWDNTVNFKSGNSTMFEYNEGLIPYEIGVAMILYICLRNSTQSLALFSPFLLIFPTILHVILVIRSFLHPGTLRALEVIGQFKFSNFFAIRFWMDLIIISLRSTNFAYGGLSFFGAQHRFRNPVKLDAVFINVASLTYCIGYTMFLYNTFGILSYELNIPIEEIMNIEKDANFIQFPLSFTHMSLTKFWTFIFYFANFLVILRSLATQSETFLSVFYELNPTLKKYTIPCSLVFCSTLLLLNILFNFKVLHIVLLKLDIFTTFTIIPVLAFYFYVFIAFFYGVMHFVDDMHFMLGFRPSNIWKLNMYVGFSIYFALSIYGFYGFSLGLTQSAMDPVLFMVNGALCMIPLIYFIIYVIIKRHAHVHWMEIFRPAKQWGPRDELLRKSRDMFSAHDMTKEYLYRQQKLRIKAADTVAKVDTTASKISTVNYALPD